MKILTIRDYTRLNSDLAHILNLMMLPQELNPVVVVIIIILLRFLRCFILITVSARKILQLNPKVLPATHRLYQCGDMRQVDY